MSDSNELVRSLSTDEIAALGVLGDPDVVSPTTDRDDRSPVSTADVHSPGMLASAPYDLVDDDPFPPPQNMTEER